jgi:hypothetical protein
MRTRRIRNKRNTRKIRGGMIEISGSTGKWIARPLTKGIVREYSNSEASFLNKLGIGYVTDHWFFNPENAVAYFKRLDPTDVLHHEVSKSEFDKVYLDMGIAMNSLREAYAKRSLNDDDIAKLPDDVREQFTTEKIRVSHTDRTDALKRILDEVEVIFEEYTLKHKRLTPTLPTPTPRKPQLTFKALPEGDTLPEDLDKTESLPPKKSAPKVTPTLSEQFEQLKKEPLKPAEEPLQEPVAEKTETPAERRRRRLSMQQATAAASIPISAAYRASVESETTEEERIIKIGQTKGLDTKTIDRWVNINKIATNLPHSDLANILVSLMGRIEDVLIDIKQPSKRNKEVILLLEESERALENLRIQIEELIAQTQLISDPESRETMMRFNTELAEIEELPEHEKYKQMQEIITKWKINVTVSLRFQKMELLSPELQIRIFKLKENFSNIPPAFASKADFCNSKINQLIDAGPKGQSYEDLERTIEMYVGKWESFSP